METVTTTPALARAAVAWNLPEVRALPGRGPGRHPFVVRMLPAGYGAEQASASAYCARCGQERNQMAHRAPKRRKCAAFGIFATHRAGLGLENPTK